MKISSDDNNKNTINYYRSLHTIKATLAFLIVIILVFVYLDITRTHLYKQLPKALILSSILGMIISSVTEFIFGIISYKKKEDIATNRGLVSAFHFLMIMLMTFVLFLYYLLIDFRF